MATASPAEILRLLARAGVDFVVVGMAAGVLRGAPVATVDLDIVHGRAPDNVARLLQVLAGLEAIYRHDARGLRPAESHLSSPGHQLLTTRLGDLDCLGTVGDGLAYEDLLDSAPELALEPGLSIHVIDLPTLIALKEKALPRPSPWSLRGNRGLATRGLYRFASFEEAQLWLTKQMSRRSGPRPSTTSGASPAPSKRPGPATS